MEGLTQLVSEILFSNNGTGRSFVATQPDSRCLRSSQPLFPPLNGSIPAKLISAPIETMPRNLMAHGKNIQRPRHSALAEYAPLEEIPRRTF